jgi:hypothetical protein
MKNPKIHSHDYSTKRIVSFRCIYNSYVFLDPENRRKTQKKIAFSGSLQVLQDGRGKGAQIAF